MKKKSDPNQSKPNQSNRNFLKSPRAPWSYFCIWTLHWDPMFARGWTKLRAPVMRFDLCGVRVLWIFVLNACLRTDTCYRQYTFNGRRIALLPFFNERKILVEPVVYCWSTGTCRQSQHWGVLSLHPGKMVIERWRTARRTWWVLSRTKIAPWSSRWCERRPKQKPLKCSKRNAVTKIQWLKYKWVDAQIINFNIFFLLLLSIRMYLNLPKLSVFWNLSPNCI